MARAVWNGAVLAESDRTETRDGYVYFPPETVNRGLLKESDTQTVCVFKGTASYYHVAVGDQVNKDAAWCYRETKPGASNIKGLIAFWKGVQVEP